MKGGKANMMTEQTMQEFMDTLASSAPVPGGGGASAYAAAIGMCLGSMVANLTTGKKKYAQYQEEIEQVLVQAEALTRELAEGMDKDAQAFEPLSKAYGLPKNTEEELQKRNEILEAALVTASEAPLALMEKILEALDILERLAVIGSKLAVSDVGVGVQMCKAALNGASLNVYINTKLMKDRERAGQMNEKADRIIQSGNEKADRIYQDVLQQIR